MVRNVFLISLFAFGLTACGDVDLSTSQQRHFTAGGGGGGNTTIVSYDRDGGWQDSTPDGRVERDDGSAVVDGGRTVQEPGESPHPTGDNDLGTDPGKIENRAESPASAPSSPSENSSGAPGKDTGVTDTDAGNSNDFGAVSS
jgi:hypothetical protein